MNAKKRDETVGDGSDYIMGDIMWRVLRLKRICMFGEEHGFFSFLPLVNLFWLREMTVGIDALYGVKCCEDNDKNSEIEMVGVWNDAQCQRKIAEKFGV